MKTLTNIVLGGVFALGMSGCNLNIEHTPVKQERTIVLNKEHTDSYEHRYWAGKAWMISRHAETNYVRFGGNTSFRINNKDMYNRFEKGDSAIILFREDYLVKYDSKDTSKQNPEAKLRLDRDFVDAVKIGNNTKVYY